LSARSLLVFRRTLAALCLLDSLSRLATASLYLSDLGLLPRYRAQLLLLGGDRWSLYMLSGRPAVMLIGLAITCGLALWGLRRSLPRPARLLLWALVSSVQVRNPLICDSSDELLRLMLFWDIFLPDQPGSHSCLPDGAIRNTATIGFQLQMAVVLGCLAAAPAGAHPGPLSLPQRCAWALGAVLLWWRPLRKPALLALGVAGALLAVKAGPIFPLTLAVGLLAFWHVGPPLPAAVSGQAGGDDAASQRWTWPSRLGKVCGVVVMVIVVVEGARPGQLVGPLGSLRDLLGLSQQWRQLSPAVLEPGPFRAEYTGHGGAPVDRCFDPFVGRREGWWARRVGDDLRIARSSLDSSLLTRRSEGWLELWLSEGEASHGWQLPRSHRWLLDRRPLSSSEARP
jgi:hypothetical protein